MEDKDQSDKVDENLAVGDTPSGSPPFLVYKRRLYVLSKKPPVLRRGDDVARTALEVQARRPLHKGRPSTVHGMRRVSSTRTRPFVKGTYRVYSSRFPHLAPTGRKKPKKRVPR